MRGRALPLQSLLGAAQDLVLAQQEDRVEVELAHGAHRALEIIMSEDLGQTWTAIDHDLPATLITADRSAAVRSAARSLDITVLNKPLKPAALRAFLTQLVNQSGARTAAE